MKTIDMKKLLIIGLLAMMSFSASAQIMDVGGGFIMAKQKSTMKYNGATNETTASGPGFYVNLGMTTMMTEGVGYTIDFFLNQWTLTADEEDPTDSKTSETNLGFVLALSLRLPVSESLIFSPYFGPVMAYGLSSKTTGKDLLNGGTAKINNYDKDQYGATYSRMDTYITVGAAADIVPSNLRLSMGVDFGMWNRLSGIKDAKIKDGPNFRFGVAYLF